MTEHLQVCIKKEKNKIVVEETQNDLFVDDLTSGGVNERETQKIKDTATQLFPEGGFALHYWHSNVPALEKSATTTEGHEETVTYSKKLLGTKSTEIKILGVYWSKQNNTLGECRLQALQG